MTTRAVHLEIVHSLSADAAVMSLRRFIARRGTPSEIISDNGTAFVGANRILTELYGPPITEFSTNAGIRWNFIPPAAPSMGGAWERLVRSVKTALRVTLLERKPKEEVLATMLAEAEAVINSRPLTYVPCEPEDLEALTPFHFLLGSSSGGVVENQLSDSDLVGRADWRKALRLADLFWNRWVREYLPCLNPRPTGGSGQLAVGDLVLVADGNLPRGTWPRGRVTKVFPGPDNQIRVAEVATATGTLRRPARKLVQLPV